MAFVPGDVAAVLEPDVADRHAAVAQPDDLRGGRLDLADRRRGPPIGEAVADLVVAHLAAEHGPLEVGDEIPPGQRARRCR